MYDDESPATVGLTTGQKTLVACVPLGVLVVACVPLGVLVVAGLIAFADASAPAGKQKPAATGGANTAVPQPARGEPATTARPAAPNKRLVKEGVEKPSTVPQSAPSSIKGSSSLTSDQRVSWEKIRSLASGKPPAEHFQVAALRAGTWNFRSWTTGGEKWLPAIPFGASGYIALDEDAAQKDLVAALSSPSCNIAAVVDLYSGPDPQIVAWYGHDGSRITALSTAPADHLRTLRAFLSAVQRDPEHAHFRDEY